MELCKTEPRKTDLYETEDCRMDLCTTSLVRLSFVRQMFVRVRKTRRRRSGRPSVEIGTMYTDVRNGKYMFFVCLWFHGAANIGKTRRGAKPTKPLVVPKSPYSHLENLKTTWMPLMSLHEDITFSDDPCETYLDMTLACAALIWSQLVCWIKQMISTCWTLKQTRTHAQHLNKKACAVPAKFLGKISK